MRLASIRRDGYRLGVVRGEKVLDLAKAEEALGAELPADIVALMGWDLVKFGEVVDRAWEELWEPLSEVPLGPPVPRPNKFLALAQDGRYAVVDQARVEEALQAAHLELPAR
ncbi:MAG TPA: hypothetical protein EYP61_05120, partial [Candidatus Latescibacteria bacterium]|nr:hypothetical protein [Candidatus Latescibacterota bacterium]